MTGPVDLWRAIDAEGGAPDNSDWCRGFNAGLEAASKHVEALGYREGVSVLPSATVAAMLEALSIAEQRFEGIRRTLIKNIEEPERSAFWSAVQGRNDARAAIARAKVRP